MGWDLIIAMVIASVVTHAWENARTRAATRWQAARDEAQAQREERAKGRADATRRRKERLRTARTSGPSDPLWWAYAVSWIAVGAVRATAAAVAGARDGAKQGAAEGYRIGHERATARQARRMREKAAYANGYRSGAEDERSMPEHQRPPAAEPGALQPDARPTPDDEPEIVEAEIVDDPAPYPPASGRTGPQELEEPTEGSTTMGELQAIGVNDQVMSGADGEGYTSTLTALSQIESLLAQLGNVVSELGDMLVTQEVDNETTTGISELYDLVDLATSKAAGVKAHVHVLHEPVAAAVNEAGADNVASRDWYGDF